MLHEILATTQFGLFVFPSQRLRPNFNGSNISEGNDPIEPSLRFLKIFIFRFLSVIYCVTSFILFLHFISSFQREIPIGLKRGDRVPVRDLSLIFFFLSFLQFVQVFLLGFRSYGYIQSLGAVWISEESVRTSKRDF